jgi:hypothetical protein
MLHIFFAGHVGVEVDGCDGSVEIEIFLFCFFLPSKSLQLDQLVVFFIELQSVVYGYGSDVPCEAGLLDFLKIVFVPLFRNGCLHNGL